MFNAWSIFVLKRVPFCPDCGPFGPWSILSMVRYVPNSTHTYILFCQVPDLNIKLSVHQ